MADKELPLGSSLTDAHMALSRAFHTMDASLRVSARRLDLGRGEPRILSYLAVHGASTQREIADFFVIDISAVSRLLDSLEKKGYLESVPGRDRRSRALELTDHGREILRVWDRECAVADDLMLADFTEAEKAQLMALIERSRSNMAAALKGNAESGAQHA